MTLKFLKHHAIKINYILWILLLSFSSLLLFVCVVIIDWKWKAYHYWHYKTWQMCWPAFIYAIKTCKKRPSVRDQPATRQCHLREIPLLNIVKSEKRPAPFWWHFRAVSSCRFHWILWILWICTTLNVGKDIFNINNVTQSLL